MWCEDMDLGSVFANAVNFLKESRDVRDVPDHIVHPDFFYGAVIEWELLGEICNCVHSITGVEIDADESFFSLISTA